VQRRGLAGIERFPVHGRFDPDRRGELTVPAAVRARAREPLLEMLHPLEPRVDIGCHRADRSGASALARTMPNAGMTGHGFSVRRSPTGRCPIEHWRVTVLKGTDNRSSMPHAVLI
jgi:hypothetical protein